MQVCRLHILLTKILHFRKNFSSENSRSYRLFKLAFTFFKQFDVTYLMPQKNF